MFKLIRNQLLALVFVLLGCGSLLTSDGDGTVFFWLVLTGICIFFHTTDDLFDYAYLKKKN